MSKNYRKLITNRIFATAICILLQLFWSLLFFFRLIEHYALISTLFSGLSIVFVLFIIKKNGNSEYKIGWILLITSLPVLGPLLYLLYGNKKPSRKLSAKIGVNHIRWKKELKQNHSILEEMERKNQRIAGTSKYLYKYAGYPVYINSTVEYFPVGEEMFVSMVQELEKAKHFIFLEYFIIQEGKMWDTIREILIRKASEGVDVRLIYDDMGCVTLLPPGYARMLEEKGIRCMAFNPVVPFFAMVMNNRDHRKILVIDGHTSFTGGVNLADEYINLKVRFGHWKDTGVKIVGDASYSFTAMFLEMWDSFQNEQSDFQKYLPDKYYADEFESDGYIQPFSDSPLDNEEVGESVYIDILNQAKSYVYIFTPYLVVSSELRNALCLASKRGVDVRIVTPGIPDKKVVYRLTRSNYSVLIQAGVKIYEYTPGFIHGKSYVCDDEYAVVGTINMDYRSLFLHFECGVFLYRSKAIKKLKEDCIETFHKSKKIALEDSKTSAIGKLFDAILQVVAPLF